MTETVFVLYGEIPAKKNLYMPMVNKSTGKAMFIKNSALLNLLGRISAQIPLSLRGAGIRHPDVSIYPFCSAGGRDRDNMLTTILDLLREVGVLVNDSIAQCNGKLEVFPAIQKPESGAIVVIRDYDVGPRVEWPTLDRHPWPVRYQTLADEAQFYNPEDAVKSKRASTKQVSVPADGGRKQGKGSRRDKVGGQGHSQQDQWLPLFAGEGDKDERPASLSEDWTETWAADGVPTITMVRG